MFILEIQDSKRHRQSNDKVNHFDNLSDETIGRVGFFLDKNMVKKLRATNKRNWSNEYLHHLQKQYYLQDKKKIQEFVKDYIESEKSEREENLGNYHPSQIENKENDLWIADLKSQLSDDKLFDDNLLKIRDVSLRIKLGKHFEDRFSLLHVATEKDNVEVVEILIENGANVNALNDFSHTPLFYAKSTNVAEILINNNAEVNPTNEKGDTPLHSAAYHGRSDIVKLLIEKGANVKKEDKRGYTPLHSAFRWSLNQDQDNIWIAKLLIESGADRNAVTKEKKTPKDLLMENIHHYLQKDLMRYYGYGIKILKNGL